MHIDYGHELPLALNEDVSTVILAPPTQTSRWTQTLEADTPPSNPVLSDGLSSRQHLQYTHSSIAQLYCTALSQSGGYAAPATLSWCHKLTALRDSEGHISQCAGWQGWQPG
jgi:hypothetical protein